MDSFDDYAWPVVLLTLPALATLRWKSREIFQALHRHLLEPGILLAMLLCYAWNFGVFDGSTAIWKFIPSEVSTQASESLNQRYFPVAAILRYLTLPYVFLWAVEGVARLIEQAQPGAPSKAEKKIKDGKGTTKPKPEAEP